MEMPTYVQDLCCIECGRRLPPQPDVYRCECGGPLEVEYDYERAGKHLSRRGFKGRCSSIWRYEELLPVAEEGKVVSLGEGGTALLRATGLSEVLGLRNLYLKDEARNPTGAFKDRETSVMVSRALEGGYGVVSIVSTGNAACSVAAYAAKAGLKSFVIVPPSAPEAKLIQVGMYGAVVVKVRGTMSEQAGLLAEACRRYGWYNANPGVNPYKVEGSKTIAYEICEQLGWRSPDYIFAPVGTGGLLAGIWKGFKEFLGMGLCTGSPRIIGVESRGASAVADAFRAGREDVLPVDARSIASGINVSFPLDGRKAIRALRESRGEMVTVSDEEILEAQSLIARRGGVFAEPAGAASLAGLRRCSEEERLDRSDLVVCLVTGSGLKDMGVLSSRGLSIPEIGSDLDELEGALRRQCFL
jgi:threonine synthase